MWDSRNCEVVCAVRAVGPAARTGNLHTVWRVTAHMNQTISSPKGRIIRIAAGVGIILLIPLVLTILNPNSHFNGGSGGGADWGPGDFLIMGILLFLTGVTIDYAARHITNASHRLFAVGVIVAALLIIWIELAVEGVSQLVQFLLGN